MATSKVGVASALTALERELVRIETERAKVVAAIAALRGTALLPEPIRLVQPTETPRTGWMRKAKRGERQATVLNAYRSLTHEIPLRDFVRGLGSTDRQRKLFRLTVDRQVGLGRMAARGDVLLPKVA